MFQSKRTFAALGLCATVLGLVVVFSASSVQAEEGANWMVNGKNVTGALLPSVSIVKVVTEDMALLTELFGKKVTLLCKGAEFIGARLEEKGKVGGAAGSNTTQFSGCQTYISGVLTASCEPHTGEKKGTFTSNPLKGLLVLHKLASGENDTLIRFEPVTGSVFATVELGEECSIGETCAISGVSTVREVGGGTNFATEALTHTVEQGPLSELWVGTNTPEHKAVVEGSASLSLGGAHEGLKWSALPA